MCVGRSRRPPPWGRTAQVSAGDITATGGSPVRGFPVEHLSPGLGQGDFCLYPQMASFLVEFRRRFHVPSPARQTSFLALLNLPVQANGAVKRPELKRKHQPDQKNGDDTDPVRKKLQHRCPRRCSADPHVAQVGEDTQELEEPDNQNDYHRHV